LQPPNVRDESTAFHTEDEIVRRLVVPLLPAGWPLKRIKRAVDLDRIELPRGVFQLAFLREILWIGGPTPRFISPTGNADARLAHLAPLSLPLVRQQPINHRVAHHTVEALQRLAQDAFFSEPQAIGDCAAAHVVGIAADLDTMELH